MPSPYDKVSDTLYAAVCRTGYKRSDSDNSLVATNKNYLCFEFLSPSGDYAVDVPTQERIGNISGMFDGAYFDVSGQLLAGGNSLSTLTIPKTTLDPKLPLSIGAGHYVDGCWMMYGNSGSQFIEAVQPKIGGYCRLTESGSNYILTAYDSGGSQINLVDAVSHARPFKWAIGFPYPSMIQTLPMETMSRDGNSTMGRIRRVNEVTFNLQDSGEFSFGTEKTDLLALGSHVFTGQQTMSIDSGYDPHEGFRIVSNYPNLLNILSFSPELTINR